MLPGYLHFVWSYIDGVCFKESLLGFVEVFARQILNVEPNIVGEVYVQVAAEVFVSSIDGISDRRKKL